MKKTIYFLTMILAVALMSTNCCKDDPVPEPTDIEISGEDWVFQSLVFDAGLGDGLKTYTSCDQDLLDENYRMINFNIEGVTESNLTLITTCPDPWNFSYVYILEDGVLNIGSGIMVFDVLNEGTYNGTVLELELTDASGSSLRPIGGVYTFTR